MFKIISSDFNVYIDAMSSSHMLAFFTNNSSFSNQYESILLTYYATNKELLPKHLILCKFIINSDNAEQFEVIKVPQIRYFVNQVEENSLVGIFTYKDLHNLLGLGFL